MKRFVSLLCFVGLVAVAFAKEKPSVALEVGVVSYESDSGQRIYNPNVHLGANFPLFAITEHCDFGIQGGYDFYFGGYAYEWLRSDNSSSYDSFHYEDQNTSCYVHLLSVLPSIMVAKNNFRVHIGTGCGIALNVYRYQHDWKETSSSSTTTVWEASYATGDVTDSFQIFWITDFGLQYTITKHFSLRGECVFLFAVYTERPTMTMKDVQYSSNYTSTTKNTKIIGNLPLYISPKIGVCYTF